MKRSRRLGLALLAGLLLYVLSPPLPAQNIVDSNATTPVATSGNVEDLKQQLLDKEEQLIQTRYGLYMSIFFIVISQIWLGTVISKLRRRKAIIKAQMADLDLFNKDIQESNRYLEELIDEKKYLVSLIAHDLRTPISVIRYVLEESRGEYNFLGKRTMDRIESVEQSVVAIEGMTQSIIEVANGGVNTKIKATEVNLRNIVDTVFGEYRNLSKHRNINLVFHRQTEVDLIQGDPFLLERVLGNLLSNAIKMSPAGAKVEVVLRFTEGWVSLHVNDHGPGIDAEQLATLFEPKTFSRSPDSVRQLVHGHGLYMSRIYVQKMKGKLEAKNAPQGGAEFILSFPHFSRKTEQDTNTVST